MSAPRPRRTDRVARHALAGVATLLVVATGCRSLAPPPRQPISAESRRIIADLETRWRAFDSLRTLADVTVDRRGERHRIRGVLVAKAPTSVRFEALSPMGQPLLLATVHDGQLTAYDATSNEAYAGPATPDVIGRFLQVPVEADDLVGVLSGRPAPPADVRVAEMLPADETGPSIELDAADHRRRVWLDPRTGAVRQLQLTGGRARIRVRYQRAPTGEVTGFELTTEPALASADVRYQNPEFGVPVAPEVFSLTIPKGAKIQQIR